QIAKPFGRLPDLFLEVEPATMAISETLLVRILDELLDNAFKFSAPGMPVLVALEPSNGTVRLSVSDSGRGMHARDIASVGAYMQFDRRVYEQQGCGLGLVIVKRLVEAHGGKLMIQSEVGVG